VSIAGLLLREGIIVKAWREKGYEHFMRVTIGKPEENNRLIEALKAIKGKLSHVAA
jgi:histidinol-phosphate aminotransferase